jgi:hypothetical protein
MPLIQIIIDDSTSKIITGTYEFDRANGGTLLVPSGSSFPGTSAAKELFWRTDEAKLYRRDDANSTWVAVVSAIAAHATTHQPGGSDAMAVDAAAGTGSLRTLGTAVTSACAGNDSRLSDARTPTAHATSHKSGGADSIKLDELAAPTDITTLDATTGQHGLLPKLGGGTTNYLRADGTWATPSGSSSIFGADYQIEVVEGTSTTTSSTMQDKVTLTTPALTGTYRVAFFCEIMIGTANARHRCQLYNVTDAAELCFDDTRPSLASMYTVRSGFQNVTFAGAAQTFKIQFANQNNSATVTIRRARIEFWRIS